MGPFDFGRSPTPRETSFGAGVKGVEKGCAIPVDVAAGGPAVRGEAGVAVAGDNEGLKEEKVRVIV